jgi:hypothetical protein
MERKRHSPRQRRVSAMRIAPKASRMRRRRIGEDLTPKSPLHKWRGDFILFKFARIEAERFGVFGDDANRGL